MNEKGRERKKRKKKRKKKEKKRKIITLFLGVVLHFPHDNNPKELKYIENGKNFFLLE